MCLSNYNFSYLLWHCVRKNHPNVQKCTRWSYLLQNKTANSVFNQRWSFVNLKKGLKTELERKNCNETLPPLLLGLEWGSRPSHWAGPTRLHNAPLHSAVCQEDTRTEKLAECGQSLHLKPIPRRKKKKKETMSYWD